MVTTVEERIESTTGTFYRDDRRLHFSGDVHMEMDTLGVRSEQVVYLPEDRVLVFPVAATVTHPSGGVSGDRGRWTRRLHQRRDLRGRRHGLQCDPDRDRRSWCVWWIWPRRIGVGTGRPAPV